MTADTSREAVEALIGHVKARLASEENEGFDHCCQSAPVTFAELHRLMDMLSSLLSERDEARETMKLYGCELPCPRLTNMAAAHALAVKGQRAAEAEAASLRTKLEECERERANLTDMLEGSRNAHRGDNVALIKCEVKLAEAHETIRTSGEMLVAALKERDAALAARTGANNG